MLSGHDEVAVGVMRRRAWAGLRVAGVTGRDPGEDPGRDDGACVLASHGHQTAMRRDRVPRVLRRDRLGHGPSGDIADHYTHIDTEMIGDMLTGQTQRWHAAVTRRARTDRARGAEPRSAVPALDQWLALLRERPGEIQLPSALPLTPKRGEQ